MNDRLIVRALLIAAGVCFLMAILVGLVAGGVL